MLQQNHGLGDSAGTSSLASLQDHWGLPTFRRPGVVSGLTHHAPHVHSSATVVIQINRVFRYCDVCRLVLDAADVDQSWSTSTLAQGCRMSTLDEITKEKQRISEALARVNAQHEKLSGQLSELEATERVLARYSNGKQTKRRSSGKATTTAAPAQSGRRRRTTTAKPARGNRSSPSLGDQILALATGKTQREIAAACKEARPNHIGIAIARHKRAGRIEERDGKLYATHSTGTERHAVV